MANANTNEKPLTAEEKKDKAFKKLIEKGKASGHLTAQEIDNLIVELDLDVDELEKLNEQIDAANINIIDDFSAEHLTELLLRLTFQRKRTQPIPLQLMTMPLWMIRLRFILKKSEESLF